jgi:hypothetical protein
MLRKGGEGSGYGKREITQGIKKTTQEKKTGQKKKEIKGPDLISRLSAIL